MPSALRERGGRSPVHWAITVSSSLPGETAGSLDVTVLGTMNYPLLNHRRPPEDKGNKDIAMQFRLLSKLSHFDGKGWQYPPSLRILILWSRSQKGQKLECTVKNY